MIFRLKPTYITDHVTNINLTDLKTEGIKGLMFDLDNTLMAPKTCKLTEDIANWLEIVQKDFKIAIISNNPHDFYIEQAAEIVGCPAYGKADKPRTAIASRALKDLDLIPDQTAMVGDRILTDILLGERLGLVTILVDPLIKNEEIILFKVLRRLERILIQTPAKMFT